MVQNSPCPTLFRQSGAGSMDNQSAILNRLTTQLNETESRTCCLELGLDYEDLEGGSRAGKARELITYLARRNRLPELTAYVERERP